MLAMGLSLLRLISASDEDAVMLAPHRGAMYFRLQDSFVALSIHLGMTAPMRMAGGKARRVHAEWENSGINSLLSLFVGLQSSRGFVAVAPHFTHLSTLGLRLFIRRGDAGDEKQ